MRSLGQFVLFLSIVMVIVGGWQFYLWTKLVRDPAWPEPFSPPGHHRPHRDHARSPFGGCRIALVVPSGAQGDNSSTVQLVRHGLSSGARLLRDRLGALDPARPELALRQRTAGRSRAPHGDRARRCRSCRSHGRSARRGLGPIRARRRRRSRSERQARAAPSRALGSHVGAADRRAHRTDHRPQVSRARGGESQRRQARRDRHHR